MKVILLKFFNFVGLLLVVLIIVALSFGVERVDLVSKSIWFWKNDRKIDFRERFLEKYEDIGSWVKNDRKINFRPSSFEAIQRNTKGEEVKKSLTWGCGAHGWACVLYRKNTGYGRKTGGGCHPSIVVDIVARARRSVKNTRWLPSLSTQLNSLKRLEIGDYKAFGIFLRSS